MDGQTDKYTEMVKLYLYKITYLHNGVYHGGEWTPPRDVAQAKYVDAPAIYSTHHLKRSNSHI